MPWPCFGEKCLRLEFVSLAACGDANIAELCRRYGVSRKTGYKWLNRYGEESEDGLCDRSRRPRHSPVRTACLAEHWKHLRTTNPIESTFATVRLRTGKTKGCLSRKTALAMAFKLAKSAERTWRKLDGSDQIGKLIKGINFRDGEPVDDAEDCAAA